MLGTLLRGVSTPQYREVLPRMAETVGVSKPSISRPAIEASAEPWEPRLGRRWDERELRGIYLGGMRFADHLGSSAGGVDGQGRQHVRGLPLGATENAAAGKARLAHRREQGVSPEKRYRCVIDGAQALRAAIREVFGPSQPVGAALPEP